MRVGRVGWDAMGGAGVVDSGVRCFGNNVQICTLMCRNFVSVFISLSVVVHDLLSMLYDKEFLRTDPENTMNMSFCLSITSAEYKYCNCEKHYQHVILFEYYLSKIQVLQLRKTPSTCHFV